jgi:hypothetical protein
MLVCRLAIKKEVPVMTGHIDPTEETFFAFRAKDRAGPIHMLDFVSAKRPLTRTGGMQPVRRRMPSMDATAFPFSPGSAAALFGEVASS